MGLIFGKGFPGKLGFDFLDAGEVVGERQGQVAQEIEFGDADGLGAVPQGVFGDDSVFTFAEQEADGGLVVRRLHLGIDGAEVEIELAVVFGFEGATFELDDDVAFQPGVVAEEIDEELVAADFEPELPADVGEAGTQFDEEAGAVADEGVLNLPLMGIVGEAEEVEGIRVFQGFLSAGGVGRRKA